VFAQTVMQLEPASGFIQILQVQIDPDSAYTAASIRGTGMTSGPASDVQYLEAGLQPQTLKFNGDHR
jgi:hypothetical protein